MQNDVVVIGDASNRPRSSSTYAPTLFAELPDPPLVRAYASLNARLEPFLASG